MTKASKHAFSNTSGPFCAHSHYAAIVEARKDVEIYQLGDIDCAECLRRMADKHAALADVFRARLVKLKAAERVALNIANTRRRCRIYDTDCINPHYCDARGGCCAGDPKCRPEDP